MLSFSYTPYKTLQFTTNYAGRNRQNNRITESILSDSATMPAGFQDGSVVWGLSLGAWITTKKKVERSTLFCDVVTDRDLHRVFYSLVLLANRPESRYVLARTRDYLLTAQPNARAGHCATADLEKLLQ